MSKFKLEPTNLHTKILFKNKIELKLISKYSSPSKYFEYSLHASWQLRPIKAGLNTSHRLAIRQPDQIQPLTHTARDKWPSFGKRHFQVKFCMKVVVYCFIIRWILFSSAEWATCKNCFRYWFDDNLLPEPMFVLLIDAYLRYRALMM